MKALILIVLLCCSQVIAQNAQVTFGNKNVSTIKMYEVEERINEQNEIIYTFSPNLNLPVQTKDTTSIILMPQNKFIMLAFYDYNNNIEWVGFKLHHYVGVVNLPLVFGDGYMYVSEYNHTKGKLENILYGDLAIYRP